LARSGELTGTKKIAEKNIDVKTDWCFYGDPPLRWARLEMLITSNWPLAGHQPDAGAGGQA